MAQCAKGINDILDAELPVGEQRCSGRQHRANGSVAMCGPNDKRANCGAGASCVMSGKRYLLHTQHLLKKRAVMDRLQRWVIAVLSCLATWPLAGWAQSPIVGTASGPVQGAIENDIAVFRGAAVCRTAGWPAAPARAAAGAGLVGRAAGKLCGRFVFAKARPVA